MKYPEKFLLKMSLGTLARIDAVSGNRSEFVRAAIEMALDGLDEVEAFVETAGRAPSDIIAEIPMTSAPAKKNSNSAPALSPLPAVQFVRPGSTVVSPRVQDKADLLALVRSKRLSSRQAKDSLGWLGLRYENAERGLMDDGVIWVSDGVLEVL